MKIEYYKVKEVPEMTVEEFAEKNDLTMEVHERTNPELSKYYARFKRSGIKNDAFLVSTHGNGSTPEGAIADYGDRISEQLLVIGGLSDTRREIQVPRIVSKLK